MTVMSLDDGNDADIILEEVSKIFRCKDCLRCFISFTKFSEHFPVHHPEKISAAKDDHRTSTRASTIILPPFAHQTVPETGTVNSDNTTVVPRRPKISLRQNKNTFVNDSNTAQSEFASNGNIDQREFVRALELHPVHKDVSGIQGDTSSPKRDRSASKDSGVDESVLVESRSPKEVEVITLSDSDDDGETNIGSYVDPLNSIRETVIRVKQEVDCDQVENPTASMGEEHVPDNTSNNIQDEFPVKAQESSSLLPPKKYLCQYCNKLFTRDRTLHSHVRGMHKAQYEKDQMNQETEDSNQKNDNCPGENGSKKGKRRSYSLSNKARHSNGTGNDFAILKNGNGKRSEGITDLGKKKKKRKRETSLPSTVRRKSATLPRETEDETIPVAEEENAPMLPFSCKWCSEKFFELDSLRRHAVNIHIKYKQME